MKPSEMIYYCPFSNMMGHTLVKNFLSSHSVLPSVFELFQHHSDTEDLLSNKILGNITMSKLSSHIKLCFPLMIKK